MLWNKCTIRQPTTGNPQPNKSPIHPDKPMPSPDGSGSILLFSLKSKNYSVQLEYAPKKLKFRI